VRGNLADTWTVASGFTVSGAHGWLVLLAFLLFAVAAIVAWFAARALWGTFVAAGLALYMLSLLVTGLPEFSVTPCAAAASAGSLTLSS
jgi:hypothetical protein